MIAVPIGELTESVKTWNPNRDPETGFDYIDLSAVDNSRKEVTAATTMAGSDAPSRARQLVAVGDVLVSTVRPNLNAVAVVPPALNGATASTGFTVLRPTKELDGRFLFHWVRSPVFINDMVRRATGASYPAVSDRIVKESRIPIPPLPEQQRTAAILDHADALRGKRRLILNHLEDLTQSIFHDMFGSTRLESSLGDHGAQFRYGTSNKSGVGGHPTLRIPNIVSGSIDTTEVKTVAVTDVELQRLALRDGDLLFVRTNGNPDNVGRCAVYSDDAVSVAGYADAPWIYASYLIRARIGESLDPTFLAAYLSSPSGRRQLRNRSRTSAGQYNINIEGLKGVLVPSVAMKDQMAFVAQVQQVRASRTFHVESLRQLDALFASLQSRAFAGDL